MDFDVSHIEVGRSLGSQGQFGEIYEGVDSRNGKRYAIKIINTRFIDPAALKQIEGETAIALPLEHPHIVKTYGSVRSANMISIYMDLYQGDVHGYVDQFQKMNHCNAYLIFRQLASAVQYLHNIKHIVHRDIKLENMLFNNDTDLNVVLADFGFSVHREPNGPLLTDFPGSPCFAAPELMNGREYIGYASDIWAMGVCLYVLVTGKYPFFSLNRREQYLAITYNDPDLSMINDVELADLIRQMLIKDQYSRININQVFESQWMKEWQRKINAGYKCGPNDVEDPIGNYSQNYSSSSYNVDDDPGIMQWVD